MKLDVIYNEDCLDGMRKRLSDKSIDLTVTSPPYDNLRTYGSYIFDFEPIAQELYRVTKDGGVVVWVVGDATANGSEVGTGFKQVLYFKEIGFNLHDTMIYGKNGFRYPEKTRYNQQFEYMFVLSRGGPKVFNPIKYRHTTNYVIKKLITQRRKDGTLQKTRYSSTSIYIPLGNIWFYEVGYMKSTKDRVAYQHPAIFPDKLAEDHILSWSNEGDIILDPMFGSGTTLKMAIKNKRHYIGFEINPEYPKIAKKRLSQVQLELIK